MKTVREAIVVEETAKPVTYDFNSSNAIDVAVMPMEFADKLLSVWINNMSLSSEKSIVGDYIDALRGCYTIEDAIKVSNQWVFERQLIENVKQGNYSRYEVK